MAYAWVLRKDFHANVPQHYSAYPTNNLMVIEVSKEKSQYEVELNKEVIRGIKSLRKKMERKHGETND